jgi:hypothetical protein
LYYLGARLLIRSQRGRGIFRVAAHNHYLHCRV